MPIVKKEDHWTFKEIKSAKDRGIPVSVDGIVYETYQPEDLVLVLEEADYMKDYIGDDNGNIVQISYDRVH